MKNDNLKILILEDAPTDAELAQAELRRGGIAFQVEVVDTKAAFEGYLRTSRPDAILSDFELPGFNGMAALKLAKEIRPDVPFIFVSGRIGEDLAIESLKTGASDYVLKNRLGKLVPAVTRALQEIEERTKREEADEATRRSEERYKCLLEAVTGYVYTVEIREGRPVRTTHRPGCIAVTGYSPEEYEKNPDLWYEMIAEDDRSSAAQAAKNILESNSTISIENRIVRRDGSSRWISRTLVPHHDDQGFLTSYDGIITDITERKQAELELKHALQKIREGSLDTIHRLAQVAEGRDENTGAHIVRMSKYSAAVAHNMGMNAEEVELILYASPMHDVGKIGIPDRILLKPAKLDAKEWKIMKQHAVNGAHILEGSGSDFLRLAEEIALTHHEKWNGSGYPHQLKETQIPLPGRITAIADVFDALTSKRPYKEAFSVEKSLAIIRESRGTHFDPDVVDAFMIILDEILSIKAKFKDEGIR